MLDEIHAMLTKYVAFPSDHAAIACALWVAHTWVVWAFFTTPRLVIQSPEPGSGKTRLLELLAILCRNAKLTMSTSAAALYRRIGGSDDPITILADEADAVFSRNATSEAEAQRAIYNSGYRKGATVDRCEGDGAKMKVTAFKVYAPVALAGLGTMPRTITTRGVVIEMRKRAPGEQVAAFRERDALTEAAPIIETLTAWADRAAGILETARPTIPSGVVDRPAEVWEPLLAVAESIGGRWPELARAACRHYVFKPSDEAASVGVRLLADLRKLFHPEDQAPITELHSADIVTELIAEPDSPWRDLWGKTLDQRKLSNYLRNYGVRPKQIRIGSKSAKGYLTAPHSAPDGDSVGLADAWQRYLAPQTETSETAETTQVSDSRFVSDESETTRLSETESGSSTSSVSAVSDVSAIRGREAAMPHTRAHTVTRPAPKQKSTSKFEGPAGPGRCGVCSWHIEKQGHADWCTTETR
ncbi:hypothetical protein L841_0076 [Mycobacterium sp. MAC_080597_8934]|uniref:DUF3631 domain-containing protein n=1 Tax=Mycobacterium sp. MAC_080597_8934 TaxID=1335322 RepID=UPI00044ABB5F|nr:DUF3631 domain-containing protein [Mycobacterium sp. MAC_080597_8934]ETZ75118.1 hypothetical protein L841_0076 [Mycobacterium sp. MAC_080597_8934]